MRWLVKVLITSLLVTSAASAASPQSCVTVSELADLFTVAGPALLETENSKCARVVTKGAVLGNQSNPLYHQLEDASIEAFPRAEITVARVQASLSHKAVQRLTREQLVASLKPKILPILPDVSACAHIDHLLEKIEHAAPRDVFGFIVEMMHLTPKRRDISLLCQDPMSSDASTPKPERPE